jgi:GNAT superfamily N-acetyltransferase
VTVEEARPATVDDVPVLAALGRRVLADLGDQRGGELFTRREARAEPFEQDLQAAVDDDDRHLIVGTFDDVPFGYGLVRREELRDGALLAVLEDFVVDPAARGVGIGEAIMDAVLAWSIAQGCIGIDAMALPGDRETKNFFESFGLKARALVVHRDLR